MCCVCLCAAYVVTVGCVINRLSSLAGSESVSGGRPSRAPQEAVRRSTSVLSICILWERNKPEATCRPWFRWGIPSGTLLLVVLKRQSSLERYHGDAIPTSHTSPTAFYVPERNLHCGDIVLLYDYYANLWLISVGFFNDWFLYFHLLTVPSIKYLAHTWIGKISTMVYVQVPWWTAAALLFIHILWLANNSLVLQIYREQNLNVKTHFINTH